MNNTGAQCGVHGLGFGVSGTTMLPFVEVQGRVSAMGGVGLAVCGKVRALVRRFSLNPLSENAECRRSVPPAPVRVPLVDGSAVGEIDLIELVERDIVTSTLNTSFDDVGGLNDAKMALREAVVLPLLRPELFTGIRFTLCKS